jgi:transposase-like protein
MRAGMVCVKPIMHIMSVEMKSLRQTAAYSDASKRELVERSLPPGASVAALA